MIGRSVKIGSETFTIFGEDIEDLLKQMRVWSQIEKRLARIKDAKIIWREGGGDDDNDYVEVRSASMARKGDPKYEGIAVLYVSNYKPQQRPHPNVTHYIGASTPWQRWNRDEKRSEVYFEKNYYDMERDEWTIHPTAIREGFQPEVWTPAEKVKRKGEGYVWTTI